MAPGFMSDSGTPKVIVTSGKSDVTMDEERTQNLAYEYLCHLEEAKNWISECISESLPSSSELEEYLRNGVCLAKLAAFFAPNVVSYTKIFDVDYRKFIEKGLHFRHTDNINHFLRACKYVGLPEVCMPETTDIYDKKNMPKVIFCLHALSLLLFKNGLGPQMEDLYGKVSFTEEEIASMNRALSAIGLPMPQFAKIGGILDSDISKSSPESSDIIINTINELLTSSNQLESLLCSLLNPKARLFKVQSSAVKKYQILLSEYKKEKLQKRIQGSYFSTSTPPCSSSFFLKEPQFNVHLTREEIQGCIDSINLLLALDRTTEAVCKRNLRELNDSLKDDNFSPYFSYQSHYAQELLEELFPQLGDSENPLLLETLVNAVKNVETKNSDNVQLLNDLEKALRESSSKKTLWILEKIVEGTDCPIFPFAETLYFKELSYIFLENQSTPNFRRQSLLNVLDFLNNMAFISEAVVEGDVERVRRLLHEPKASFEDIIDTYSGCYFEALKKEMGTQAFPLTHCQIQRIVDDVNSRKKSEELISSIQKVNFAVNNKDERLLYEALSCRALNLGYIQYNDISHTLSLLHKKIDEKRRNLKDSSSELWNEDIVEAIILSRTHAQEAQDVAFALSNVHNAVAQGEDSLILEALSHSSLHYEKYVKENQFQLPIIKKLVSLLESKKTFSYPWISHRLSDGIHDVYLNLKTLTTSWIPPKDFTLFSSSYFSWEELARVLKTDEAQEKGFENIEDFIIRFQARIRGYITRKRIFKRLQHYYDNEASVILCQFAVRRHLTARQNKDEDETGHSRSRIESLRCRDKFSNKDESMKFYEYHTKDIIIIQRAWRTWKKSIDLKFLLSPNATPEKSLLIVRKYLHSLELKREDFHKELYLQTLKGDISKVIRNNRQLEELLDGMDIKIGLLVKNKISNTQKARVLSQNKGSTLYFEEHSSEALPGLKALKKESKDKLDAYQHLFYHLQTHPDILAKLIFVMPQVKTSKFIESVIYSLYNFGANQREEYLLLQLFERALEYEVFEKVDKVEDVVAGQPLVLKMIVSFYRNGCKGQSSLRQMLGPSILRILEDKNLCINTNPVEIYKQWVNQREYETGVPSGLPYNISLQKALTYEAVSLKLSHSLRKLKTVTTLFLMTILKAKSKIPYGMLYMAKALYVFLSNKFPSTQQKDLLKIIGNLIYYRFINSAIVAPDAFDIIDVTAENALNTEQRRNLGSIAKILQFAASKKGFGEESKHLMPLNPYIIECHEKFKKFFLSCVTEIREPEEEFNMDQYSEATLLAKPVIYMSHQEILDTHQLLIDYSAHFPPEDQIHSLLGALGSNPSLVSLLGASTTTTTTTTPNSKRAGNGGGGGEKVSLSGSCGSSEVALTLSNKFINSVDRSDTDKLFIKTKHLIVSILPCTTESSLIGSLKSISTKSQETIYWKYIELKESLNEQAAKNKSLLELSNPFIDEEGRLPLEDCKRQILKNLRILENGGYVSNKNGCHAIIASLAQDILNQREYRVRRHREIIKLEKTLLSLQEKRTFISEQVDYFEKYLKTILSNYNMSNGERLVHHTRRRRRVHFSSSSSSGNSSKLKSRLTLKYSASRLFEKGILLAIEGLPSNQFKNVLFEIVPTTNDGIFEIHAKFMGVLVEHVDVDIQELLQLQYEGVSVMNMFGKSRINVNLLLHFLNSKFYGRRKK